MLASLSPLSVIILAVQSELKAWYIISCLIGQYDCVLKTWDYFLLGGFGIWSDE